jgi:MFS family permease
VAVVITAFTTHLGVLGGTRWLEGASTAASVPSILGYIAMVTAKNEALRGRTVARFEGATLLGLGVGFATAPLLFQAMGPNAFLLNAVIYGISFLIYLKGVQDPAGERETLTAPHFGLRRYRKLLGSAHVWLLAPTWIAVNASIGLWFSQSIFQLARPDPRFPDQVLMQGFSPGQITVGAVIVGAIFGIGLLYWGEKFRNLRRTTIIFYGVIGGGVLVGGGFIINHGWAVAGPILGIALLAAAGGLFVLAGATPAALGLLADISERFPADRGAIMGLYSVFLGLGQIVGAIVGGFAAEWRGIDGLLTATVLLMFLALIPLARLRQQEHYVDAAETVAILGDSGRDEATPG